VSYPDFLDFWRYAAKGVDQDTLCAERGISRQELSSRFRYFLILSPHPSVINQIVPPKCVQLDEPWAYGFDGKWVGRSPVVGVHRDVTHKETLWWGLGKSESVGLVRSDLISLVPNLTRSPEAGVTDGKPGVNTVIGEIFKLPIIQRCLVHVERDLKNYLPLHSPILATQALRLICLPLTHIKTKEERDNLYARLSLWETAYGHLLKERTIPERRTIKKHWWYTHGNLRRAWRLLHRDPASLFHYLDNPLAPATNNSLEGVNRHLPRRAGMGKGKQISLMFWRLAFSRLKTPRQRKLLWDKWKQLLNP